MNNFYEKNFVIEKDCVFESSVEAIKEFIKIIDYPDNSEVISVSSCIANITYNREVYSTDILQKYCKPEVECTELSKITRELLSKIIDGIDTYWENKDKVKCCIPKCKQDVLKKLIKMKQNKVLLEIDGVTAQEVLCRIDTLIREKFNIKKRQKLMCIHFVSAIEFILSINSSSLANKAFKMRKKV